MSVHRVTTGVVDVMFEAGDRPGEMKMYVDGVEVEVIAELIFDFLSRHKGNHHVLDITAVMRRRFPDITTEQVEFTCHWMTGHLDLEEWL